MLWSRFIVAGLWLVAAGGPAAAQPSGALTRGDLALTLEGGAGQWAGNPPAPIDMVLDLVLRDGQWDNRAWGYAMWFNRGHHLGQVAVQENAGALTVSVQLTIADDPTVPGGEASYVAQIKREGNQFAGTYSGKFLGTSVSGKVAGQLAPGAVQSVSSFKAPAAGEHPRLIFRKSDLAELARRAQTDEGKAMVQVMRSRSPVRQVAQTGPRRASWLAANWGVLYHLAGEKEGPDYARQIIMSEVIRKPPPNDAGDIHLAPRLLGLALAYDLCYDAWDAEFRSLLTTYLRQAMNDLYRGVNENVAVEGIVFDPWCHRNAVRMGAVGCAAMALMGEKDADGRPIDEAAHIAQVAERDIIAYLRLGLMGTGAPYEGEFAKTYALSNGLLQFMHANRVSRGRDLSRVNPMLLAGYVLTSPGHAIKGIHDYGISSISVQASGRWPMGLATVPGDLMPAMKWCFDHNVGLQGKAHFDLAYPYHGAYALMNYPFGGESKAPPEGLGSMFADARGGAFVFRSHWKQTSDFVTVLQLQSQPLKGMELDQAYGPTYLRVWGLGQDWFAGPVGPQPMNKFFGGRVLAFENPRPSQAVVATDLDALFLRDLVATGRRPPPEPDPDVPYLVKKLPEKPSALPKIDPKLLKEPDVLTWPQAPSAYRDQKIKCRRYFGIDYSGASGAPALLVLLDRIETAGPGVPYDPALKQATVKLGRFTQGEPTGPNMSGAIVSGRSTGRGKGGSADHYMVFTIQNGAPPAIKVEGQGVEAKVSVGQQTVWFDGARIVFAR